MILSGCGNPIKLYDSECSAAEKKLALLFSDQGYQSLGLVENHAADIEPLRAVEFAQKKITVSVLRLDCYLPQLSGNKYFKLKYNLLHAVEAGFTTVISFGGAYSNHLHALAFACQCLGIQLVAVIRGERAAQLSATLSDIEAMGGQLIFVSRQEYKQRYNSDYQAVLTARYTNAYLIPEGGSNSLALQGSREIVDHIRYHLEDRFDTVLVACGTGATAAGIASGLSEQQRVLAISVLKSAFGLQGDIERLLLEAKIQPLADWQVLHDYAGAGYGKCDKPLAEFIQRFKDNTGIETEPVYTGKLFKALFALVQADYFKPGERLVVIHTGGMQGLRGMQARIEKLLTS